MKKNYLLVFMFIVLLLAACGPETISTGTSPAGTTELQTPQTIEPIQAPPANEAPTSLPVATDTVAPVRVPEAVAPPVEGTPSAPKMVCQGEILPWAAVASEIRLCNEWGKWETWEPGLGFAFTSAGFALAAPEIATTGTVIGTVSTGAELTAAVIVVFNAVAPPIAFASAIILPVKSLIDLAQGPPQITPELEGWLTNRYPPPLVMGIQDKTGAMQLPPTFITDKWSEAEKSFRGCGGATAIIIEDDVFMASITLIALNSAGCNVIGIFPSCESWMAVGLKANLFTLDFTLDGAMTGVECAPIVIAQNPTAVIIMHSSHNPGQKIPGENESFNNFLERIASPGNKVGGAEKKGDMITLIQELMRLFGGG